VTETFTDQLLPLRSTFVCTSTGTLESSMSSAEIDSASRTPNSQSSRAEPAIYGGVEADDHHVVAPADGGLERLHGRRASAPALTASAAPRRPFRLKARSWTRAPYDPATPLTLRAGPPLARFASCAA